MIKKIHLKFEEMITKNKKEKKVAKEKKKDKWYSGWALFFWIIFFWPAAIVYMIIKSSNRGRK